MMDSMTLTKLAAPRRAISLRMRPGPTPSPSGPSVGVSWIVEPGSASFDTSARML